jgi:hypothetical protein
MRRGRDQIFEQLTPHWAVIVAIEFDVPVALPITMSLIRRAAFAFSAGNRGTPMHVMSC